MPQHWFIKTKSGKKGPITSKALVRLAAQGKLHADMGVSSDGESWIQANKIVGLSFPDAEPKRWLVKTKFGEAGPFTITKLRKLARDGRIGPDFAVSCDGKQWIKAKRVPGLKFPKPVETTPEQEMFELAIDPSTENHPSKTGEDSGDVDTSKALPLNAEMETESSETESVEPNDAGPAGSETLDEPPQAELQPLIDDNHAVDENDAIDEELEADEVDEVSDTEAEGIPSETTADDQTKKETPRGEENTATEPENLDDDSLLVAPSFPYTSIDLKARWSQLREAEYARKFGPIGEVARSHERSNRGVTTTPDGGPAAIDIYVHPPSARRPITTLVTSGMSDIAMAVPHGSGSPRAELVMYVQKMHPGYITVLRALAQLPHRQKTPLSYGSLLNNGNPTQPIFEGSRLDCYIFLIPNIESDFKIHESLRIDDDPLHLLWVVPITHDERDFISQQGIQQFCQLLDQNNHSLALDPLRGCYLRSADALATT